jgi:hypothetical protein
VGDEQRADNDKIEYRERIVPGLDNSSLGVIAQALGVSVGYAGQVRKGKKFPDPRQCEVLANFGDALI